MTSSIIKKASLVIRAATKKDVNSISDLVERVYPNMPPLPKEAIRNLVQSYPEVQFIALFDNKIIGYSAAIKVSSKLAFAPHTWDSISAKGNATTHDPDGDYLYGIETCVDRAFWHHHIGHRLYNERKEYCIRHHLKGIVFGARMSKFAEYPSVETPEQYFEMVQQDKILDSGLQFQIHNGFEFIGILKDYFPDDKESRGYAAHLVWHNPELLGDEQHKTNRQYRHKHHYLDPDHVRVAAVQYKQRKINSFEEFSTHVEYFISSVAEYHADFVLFPESFTMQLLSIGNKPLAAHAAIAELTTYTDRYKDMMMKFAMHYNINIIGGSIATQEKDHIQNVAYVFLRDGSIHAQGKIHPTPDERHVWGMKGASKVNKIMTDCGPIGVLICYDSEFPELTRHLIDQGIYILFVPFCTDQRLGYLRVRYCAQARAVENQCYVAIAGNVGNLPDVYNMNVQYAQSCILTPCDFPFARDGIAADTTPNVETIAVADLNIKTLIAARNTGSVINLKDRRPDLYSLNWNEIDE